jgi:hypothetical protein
MSSGKASRRRKLGYRLAGKSSSASSLPEDFAK